MKRTQKARWFLSGILTAAIAANFLTPALAALVEKTIQVYTGVNVYVDDVKLDPKDANGNPVDVFVYNGTTYLPVRAVGEAVGKTVQWEGTTNSVYLGKHTGEKPAVWLKDLDYFTGERWSNPSTMKDNLGNTHNNVITGDQCNVYKINGQYSKISGTLFFNYDARTYNAGTKSSLEIYGDGELLYSAEMSGSKEPIDFSVDLSGILELKIRFDCPWNSIAKYYTAAIADCGLWT